MHNYAHLPRQAFLRQSHSFVLVFLYYAKLLFFRLQNYCLPHTYMHTHIHTSKMDIIYSCSNLLGITLCIHTYIQTYIHACMRMHTPSSLSALCKTLCQQGACYRRSCRSYDHHHPSPRWYYMFGGSTTYLQSSHTYIHTYVHTNIRIIYHKSENTLSAYIHQQ